MFCVFYLNFRCYKYYNSPMPFLAAERQCNSIGGNLVAVQSGFEKQLCFWNCFGCLRENAQFLDWSQSASVCFMVVGLQYFNVLHKLSPWTARSKLSLQSDKKLWLQMDVSWRNHTRNKIVFRSGACNSALPFVCTVDSNAQHVSVSKSTNLLITCITGPKFLKVKDLFKRHQIFSTSKPIIP